MKIWEYFNLTSDLVQNMIKSSFEKERFQDIIIYVSEKEIEKFCSQRFLKEMSKLQKKINSIKFSYNHRFIIELLDYEDGYFTGYVRFTIDLNTLNIVSRMRN